MKTSHRTLLRAASWTLVSLLVSAALAASTATFTEGPQGTFPKTLKFDREAKTLTIDLSGLPKDAHIFRAELYLKPRERFAQAIVEPTTVYPVGQPGKKLPLIGPRFVSLDASEAVQAAVDAGRPAELKLEVTLQGVERLEVSYLEGKPPAQKLPAVRGLKVTHSKGQSLLVFREPELMPFPQFQTGGDVEQFKQQLGKKHAGLVFRVWRSPERITTATLAKARLVGECAPMTAWNDGYHQDDTKKKPPLRYRVTDGGEPVAWGTGIYAHNPPAPGKAFYAVTVAVDGQEDLDALGSENTTAEPVDEIVGQGEPILQWIERVGETEQWQYRNGPLVRLIYTRWESWPHASRPGVPIDYLVAIPLLARPEGAVRETQYRAFRVEPAPVGLHLHCWGGSVNGGYGWWFNAHRGAVLIASNQVPYDWWTGYHEANNTCKTYGDGRVQPFTMNRLLDFLDWATRQHREAPAEIRHYWPPLDLARVFTAGGSMGGSGAPMYAIRHGQRIAWALGTVGVHVPELSPTFKGSYENCYGPRNDGIAMPDGKTSPWDHFSDVWWLKNHVADDTGLIIASNGKDDGGIGWEQARLFARTLQETRRPHYFNWDCAGHGTGTLVGSNFDIDVRSDQSLPAFSNCSLDDDIGTAKRKSEAQLKEDRDRQQQEIAAGRRKEIKVDPYDGATRGQYNAHLSWKTDNVVDTPDRWEMTIVLGEKAPKDRCTVDLTPRRAQRFKARPGQQFTWRVTSDFDKSAARTGQATADEYGLVTLKAIPLDKTANRVVIERKK